MKIKGNRAEVRFRVDLGTISGTFFDEQWVTLLSKCAPKTASKKGGPPDSNSYLLQWPEAPGEAASRAHVSNNKQEFEHKFQTLLLEVISCVRKSC